MSALAGWLNLDGAPADARDLRAMMARLRPYGPDGEGTWAGGPLALGHARLAITPEAAGENSPQASRDGARLVAFDGRLDHRDDLCAALGVPAAERGAPDPELVLRAHEKWGEACAARLEGEFAFALWDARRRELLCARDVFGHREFYFFNDGRRFVFATRVTALLAAAGVPRALNEDALAAALGAPAPGRTRGETLYAGLHSLPGAHTLVLRVGGERQPAPRPYWRLAMEPELRLGTGADYAEALRDLVDRAVRSALRTRLPVAAMLSGGLDSTGVAVLAARALAARGEQLTTVSNVLTADFAGDEWRREESGFIRAALAIHPNMAPQFAHGRRFPVIDFDDARLAASGFPEGDPKAYRTRELFTLAAERGARVTLGGMGGDMAASFPGYGHLEQLARGGRWLALVGQLRRQAAARGMTAGGIFRREVLRPFSPWWLRAWRDERTGRATDTAALSPVNPEFAARLRRAAASAPEAEPRPASGAESPLDYRRTQLAPASAGRIPGGGNWARGYCPTMESPQPLMDRRIWEWCHRVPVGEFIRDGMPRGLYRRALHDV
ncbi:MAG: hypothetical protein RLZZ15_2894, partial [Verrucomicrobiota bacterium]